jgi:hypothetical protein
MTSTSITGKTAMRKTVASFALFGALAVPAIALAATSSADTGGYCVKSARGCQAALDAGAQNGSGAGSGAFGAIGKGGDIPNYAGGANGYQTGINNSAVAGNRQGNLGGDPTP